MPEKASDLERARKQLRKWAFGKANDWVKLVLDENVDIGKLDLSMLTEFKRDKNGSIQVKLLDRLQAVEKLLELSEGGDEAAAQFLSALLTGAAEDEG
ncbi:MAG: XRE family transcriptional regulator [Clostridia bacterium]|nr:XRE family transcriptional regulator [Clostridia bacterium]